MWEIQKLGGSTGAAEDTNPPVKTVPLCAKGQGL